MNDIISYIRGLPIKEWGVTLIGGLLGLIGIVYVEHNKRQAANKQRAVEDAKLRHDDMERVRHGERTFDIAQTQDLTVRFKSLMDGYEARIIDLTNALKASADENRELRAENQALRDKLHAS